MEDKELTPCEELGYKVGDKFTYSPSGNGSGFEEGSVIELVRDDQTDCPYFKLVKGTCKWDDDLAYVYLEGVTPFQKEEPWVALASPEEVKTKLQVGSSVKLRGRVTEVIHMYTDGLCFETAEENPWDGDFIMDTDQVRDLFASIYYRPSESLVAEQEDETDTNAPVEEEVVATGDLEGSKGAPKQPRYTTTSGADTIDECADRFTVEEFRGAMKFNIKKYNDRAGHKDDIIMELDKVIDYAQRWKDYELKLEVKKDGK